MVFPWEIKVAIFILRNLTEIVSIATSQRFVKTTKMSYRISMAIARF
jgi:hypothetical protein